MTLTASPTRPPSAVAAGRPVAFTKLHVHVHGPSDPAVLALGPASRRVA